MVPIYIAPSLILYINRSLSFILRFQNPLKDEASDIIFISKILK